MSEYKRLTIRIDNGLDEVYYPVEKDPEGLYDILDLAKYVDDGDGEEAQILLNASDRLAQYEDIGSPEELAELAKAKAEERLVILPCKVEDEIILEAEIMGLSVGKAPYRVKGISIDLYADWGGVTQHRSISKEAAEAALKNGGGQDEP